MTSKALWVGMLAMIAISLVLFEPLSKPAVKHDVTTLLTPCTTSTLSVGDHRILDAPVDLTSLVQEVSARDQRVVSYPALKQPFLCTLLDVYVAMRSKALELSTKDEHYGDLTTPMNGGSQYSRLTAMLNVAEL